MGKLHLSVRFLCDPLELCTLIYTRWVDLAIFSDSLGIFPFLISFPLSLKQPWGRLGISLAFCAFHVLAAKSLGRPGLSMVSWNQEPAEMSVPGTPRVPFVTACLFLCWVSMVKDIKESQWDPEISGSWLTRSLGNKKKRKVLILPSALLGGQASISILLLT